MTGGHGSIGSLGRLDHGIEIWMRKLNSIDIAEDGKTVRLGGGLKVKEITDALWAEGKQTSLTVQVCKSKHPLTYGSHGTV